MIGAESVSHQNLVRASKVCMNCGQWVYLDENLEIAHLNYCAFPGGDWVKFGWGGSQYRATKAPPSTASQEEAAAWPHV